MIVNGWYQAVPVEAPDDLLGAAVQEGLRVGDDPVDIPTSDHEEWLQPLLKAAKVRSFTAFGRDARAVGISRDESGAYAVIPMRNPNRSRGNSFLYMVEQELTVPPGASAADLGAAARAGLRLSVVAGSSRFAG